MKYLSTNTYAVRKAINWFENERDDGLLKLLVNSNVISVDQYQVWKEHFHCSLDFIEQRLIFENDSDLSMFLLKWS